MGFSARSESSEDNNIYSPVSVSVCGTSSVINKTIKSAAVYLIYSGQQSTSTQIWQDRGESEAVRSRMKQTSPVRTFRRHMRTPSRMDRLEDLWTPPLLVDFPSRRLFKLCRFQCRSW